MFFLRYLKTPAFELSDIVSDHETYLAQVFRLNMHGYVRRRISNRKVEDGIWI